MATDRCGALAKSPIIQPDHVAVRLADGQELMKRQDQPGVRQDASRHQEKVQADRHEVMEVHNIRLGVAQEFGEPHNRARNKISVPSELEAVRQEQVFVRPPVEAGDDGPG